MKPIFTLDKIKYRLDPATFQKAVTLYEEGKVTKFKDMEYGYSAIVLGTQPYDVYVAYDKYDVGECNCYLGQNDTLCKHMIAVAFYVLKQGEKLTQEEKEQVTRPRASGTLGKLTKNEEKYYKAKITCAIACIKYYSGPSKIWFTYQDSLTEGCNRLAEIIAKLPISVQTSNLIVNILLRLDKKLQNGVDDSDGTVGGFIEDAVNVLLDYEKTDKKTTQSFKKLVGINSCFGWEEPLVQLLNN